MNRYSDKIRQNIHNLKYLLAVSDLQPKNPENRKPFLGLQHRIAAYESIMHTGNPALDAILTKSWKRCRQENIQWSCMADGTALRYVKPADLRVLMGNILDNAIEGAGKVTDPEKRYISLHIQSRGNMAFIRSDNFCAEEPEFRNGLPVTTKKNPLLHGYGLRSVRRIARHYNGNVFASAEDGIFSLRIMLLTQ